MATQAQELILHVLVRCSELPGRRFVDPLDSVTPCKDPVYLGIQKDKVVIDLIPADRAEAEFRAEFRVGLKKDGSPNFLGPYSQGSANDRFFYLSWGVRSDPNHFRMFRRLKIRLGQLTWTQIQKAAKAQRPIEVSLRMTDAKGGPLCATPPKTHINWRVA